MVLKKIGLTGSTGMLGRHLHATLKNAGAEVICVSSSATQGNLSVLDLNEWLAEEELDALFDGVQAVVHAGASVQTNGLIDEGRMFNVNVRACANLGQWALSRGLPVVHISSAVVYADISSDNLDEDAPLGWSGLGGFYGLSKLLAEDVFKRLIMKGLKLAVVRPSSLYGYGLPADKMVSSFLSTAKDGGVIKLTSPIDDRVDFIHAADVALAVLAILQQEKWDTFNIASGCALTIKELAEACVLATGRGSVSMTEGHLSDRKPNTRFALNVDRAKLKLGWKPQFDITRGLTMMLKECVYADSPASIV